MSDTTEYVLAKAFDLIEAEQFAEAQQLLKPLIESDRNDADVWWLYAHAVTDPETAHVALQNVLRIDKDYPEAKSLLQTLESNLPSEALDSGAHYHEPFNVPNLPATLPGLPNMENDDDEDNEVGRSWRNILIPVAIMGIVLVVVILMLLQSPAGNSDASRVTPTADQAMSTSMPAQDAGEYVAIYASLAAFNLPEQAVSLESTAIGNMLVVTVCESDRRQARQTLPLVLDTLASNVESINGDFEAIGSRVQNCDTGEAWMGVGVSRQLARDYSSGKLGTADFQAAWQPIE